MSLMRRKLRHSAKRGQVQRKKDARDRRIMDRLDRTRERRAWKKEEA